MNKLEVIALLPDFKNRSFYPGIIRIEGHAIKAIKRIEQSVIDRLDIDSMKFVLPPLVDAHIHIESSMLVPSRFAEIAVKHGTVATVSDPHEIANVLGEKGVSFMIENGKTVPLKFNFVAPSCVPATAFEESGATLNADNIASLFDSEDLVGLGEMMNFPGVIYDDPEVYRKIELSKERGLPVDGHAPGLKGEDLKKYIDAGITSDHEAVSIEEAEEKIQLGMKILIREGSAAKNFDDLAELISKYPDQLMLCSDDLHPDDLQKGHINSLLKRALNKGINIFDLMKVASINPVGHYNLKVGQLKEGDPADFIVVKDLKELKVLQTFIDGIPVYNEGILSFESKESRIPNKMIDSETIADDFRFYGTKGKYRIIIPQDGSLITKQERQEMRDENGIISSDPDRDILKIAVVNRYRKSKPAVAWIKNFGLKEGAIASTVAHDSHNIVVVGVDDESISKAVNSLIRHRGGIIMVNSVSESVCL